MDFTIDRSVVESQEEFLLEELDTSISNVLLEENVFSIEDHDDVNNLNKRKERTKKLYEKILEKSPGILDPFLFALNELNISIIIAKFKECRGLGIPSVVEPHFRPTGKKIDKLTKTASSNELFRSKFICWVGFYAPKIKAYGGGGCFCFVCHSVIVLN